MMWHRLLTAVLLIALTGTTGCRRMANETVAYKDEIPPPAEPFIRQVPNVGRYGGRFVLGATNNPRTFNAMMASETSSTDITDRLFGFLVGFNLATQEYEPGLAKSWEVGADGVTWTFHLRKGAAFSDGHPLRQKMCSSRSRSPTIARFTRRIRTSCRSKEELRGHRT